MSKLGWQRSGINVPANKKSGPKMKNGGFNKADIISLLCSLLKM